MNPKHNQVEPLIEGRDLSPMQLMLAVLATRKKRKKKAKK
jgi:hypothetical protein